MADRGKKLGADELYSLTPPVELLVVVKVLKVFPLLKYMWVCSREDIRVYALRVWLQLHVDQTC